MNPITTTPKTPAVVLSENNHTASYPTLNQAWWLMGYFFLMQLPAALPAIGLKFFADQWGLPFLDLIGTTVAYVLAMWLTIRYGFKKRGSRNLSLGTSPILAYPVAAIGLVAMSTLLEPLITSIPIPAQLQELITKLFSKNMVISAVVAAPILEEILFRGIVLDGFLKNYRPAKAIIWSGVIFGCIHLIPTQAINAMFIGLVFGWLYYRTRSLWLCMFLHFVNNAMSSLVFLVDDTMDMSKNLTRVWVNNDTLYVVLLLLCVALCVGCYAYLNQILPKATQQEVPAL